MNNKEERIYYLDILRIIATLGVVLVHVAASKIYDVEVASIHWNVFNISDSLVRWCVPIFVMISGALFLGKNIEIKTLYKKNILRLLLAFLFWSIIYAITFRSNNLGVEHFIYSVIKGYYHLWFLLMIISIYLLIPLINKIIESKKLLNYSLILLFLFASLFPTIINIISYVFPSFAIEMNQLTYNFKFPFVGSFSLYFLLGYYLNNRVISRKCRICIYLLCFLGFITTIIGTYSLSVNEGRLNISLYNFFSLNVFFETIGIFVLTRQLISKVNINKFFGKILSDLSKYCFGIYLVHALVLDKLMPAIGFSLFSFNVALSTVLMVMLVFFISFVLSFILNHIPIIKKYIV